MKATKLFAAAAVFVMAATSSVSAMTVSASVESKITVEINAEAAPEAEKIYTGVIVDCRGLGLQRAMSPVIKDTEGIIIYGDKNIDPDKIVDMGMAGYATNMTEVERAGENPLIVKAVGAVNFNCNPVLKIQDAEKVLRANELGHFLEDADVVFLVD